MTPEFLNALWGPAELNRKVAPVNATCHAKIGQECSLIEVKDYSAVVGFDVDAQGE